MKLLLDTPILIWAMGEPAKLGPALRELLEDPRHSWRPAAPTSAEVPVTAGRRASPIAWPPRGAIAPAQGPRLPRHQLADP